MFFGGIRVAHAKPDGPIGWRLIGQGSGIHWDDIDEDISVEGLLLGKHSVESHGSFLAGWQRERSDATSM